MYELEQLLVIRTRREDRARGDLQVARQAVSRAEADLEKQQLVLEDYNKSKEARRSRIYDSIIGREVKRDDIELAREGVARIDREGVLKADNVERAKEVLKEKKLSAEKSKAQYILTAKERSKIIEHKTDWEKDYQRELEYRQDIELEDFTGKKVKDDRDE